MTRLTGATAEQIEAAAYADCLDFFGGDKTKADAYFADGSWQSGTIKTVQQWASLLVDTDHRIVSVKKLKRLAEFVIACNDEFRVDGNTLAAAMEITALIGDGADTPTTGQES